MIKENILAQKALYTNPTKGKITNLKCVRYFTLKKGDTRIIKNEIKSLLYLEHLSSLKGEKSTFCKDLRKKPISASYFPDNQVQ